MHPWEDFAETFAHYLHITGTLQTAAAIGIHLDAAATNLRDTDVDPLVSYRAESVQRLLSDWDWMSQAFNRINRAMGLGDLYPFQLPAPVRTQARLHARHRDARAAHPRPADRQGPAGGRPSAVTRGQTPARAPQPVWIDPTAREMTIRVISNAAVASSAISAFARELSGIVSVGLNALELVTDR